METSADPDRDLWRRVGHALADAHLSAPRTPLRHPGPCGERAWCPRGCRTDVRTLERVRSGDIIVRCCVREVVTPNDYRYPEFMAAFS